MMDNNPRKSNLLSDEKKRQIIQKIIEFFKKERNEEIGIIAAENVLNFIIENLGKDLYNKGVEDSRVFIKSRFEDLELDMEILLKR